jgi:tetratricopeptide (TPR) repeat protein
MASQPASQIPLTPPASSRNPLLRWVYAHENLAFLALALLWILALYGRVLTAPFVSGDLDQIVFNPALDSWKTVWHQLLLAPGGLTRELRGTEPGSFYRPLYWLSLAIDRHIWGLKPAGFHATNLVLALLSAFTGFRLLRALYVPVLVAGASALVWLGLPVNTEVIAWISARAYSLCAIFVFLALLCAAWAIERDRNRALFLVGFFLAALCALLAHPAGLLVLPLTVLVILAAERGSASHWAWLAGIAVAADLTWLATKYLIGPLTPAKSASAWGLGLSFFQYLRWIAVPAQMSVERSTGVPASGSSSMAIVAWIAALILAGLAFFLWRSRPAAAAGLAWMGIALVPFCGLLVLGEGMAERFVFLASAGFALFLVSLAANAAPIARRALVVLLILWTAWGGWRSFGRAGEWTDPARLYTASLLATPNSPVLYYNLGLVSGEHGDAAGAERNYRESLRLRPGHVETMLKLAAIFEDKREYERSEEVLRKIIDLDPRESRAYTGLGMIMYEEGHVADAESMFGAAVRYNRTDPDAYFHLAQLYQEGGNGDAAIQMYKKVLQLRPGDPDVTEDIRILKSAMAAAAAEQQ